MFHSLSTFLEFTRLEGGGKDRGAATMVKRINSTWDANVDKCFQIFGWAKLSKEVILIIMIYKKIKPTVKGQAFTRKQL